MWCALSLAKQCDTFPDPHDGVEVRVKNHGMEFGTLLASEQNTDITLTSQCGGISLSHGSWATDAGMKAATNVLTVKDTSGQDEMAVLLMFSQPIQPGDVRVTPDGESVADLDSDLSIQFTKVDLHPQTPLTVQSAGSENALALRLPLTSFSSRAFLITVTVVSERHIIEAQCAYCQAADCLNDLQDLSDESVWNMTTFRYGTHLQYNCGKGRRFHDGTSHQNTIDATCQWSGEWSLDFLPSCQCKNDA